VTTTLFAAFLGVLEVIRPAFTPQTFAKLVVILVGWIRTHGRHALTEALVVTGLSGLRDHSAFHRVHPPVSIAWSASGMRKRGPRSSRSKGTIAA
jgi:hypothetical protein